MIGSLKPGQYKLQITCDNSVVFVTNPDDILSWDDTEGVLRAFRLSDDNMYDANSIFEVSAVAYDQIQYIDIFCNEKTFERIANDFKLSEEDIKRVKALIHKVRFVRQNGFMPINDNNPEPDTANN